MRYRWCDATWTELWGEFLLGAGRTEVSPFGALYPNWMGRESDEREVGCSFAATDWLLDLPAYAFWFSVCASSFCVRAAVLELAGPLGRTVLEGRLFALGVVVVLGVVVCVEVDFVCDPAADTEPTKPQANRKIEPVRSSFFMTASLSPCSTTSVRRPSVVIAIDWPTPANPRQR